MSPESFSNMIRICPNGHVHLEFGFTTIHLEMDQFQALLKEGREALNEYKIKASSFGMKSLNGWFN